MRFILILAAVVAAEIPERVNYEGFKVYQLFPKTNDHLEAIKLLTKAEDYDVWSPIRHGAGLVDVMVNPKSEATFHQLLRISGIQYKVLIENLERVIQTQRVNRARRPQLRKGEIDFAEYNTFEEIQAYLNRLTDTYSNVTIENIGKSLEGRDLNVIKISSDPTANKPIIFIDGGIHAREWISPATVLYFIHQLVENPQSKSLLNNVDWYIIPSLNPDGYSYSFTNDRMWRKTRSLDEETRCIGVDPNRNFGFHWGGLGSGEFPCGQDYRGKRAFSEIETDSFRKYIWKIKADVKLYLTFHSYGNYLLYPWSYTPAYPENADELQRLGDAAAEGIRSVSGTNYIVGSSTNILYETAGSSDDWVKGEAGVELAYTIELPGKNYGFTLPPKYILPVAEETWQGVLKFHEYIEQKYGRAQ